MKTKTLLTTFIIAALLLCSCGGGNQQQQAGDLPVIDIRRNHPQKQMRIQDIATTIEYIPLETTDDILLGQHSALAHVSDRYIVVTEFTRGDIFVFNRNGKAISHFNHRGQGPREYTSFGQKGVAVDENAGEIFVLNRVTHRILVYSISGEYQRTLRFSTDLNLNEIYSFDNETLLVYDDVRLTNAGPVGNEKPYLLLSKQDGSIVYTFDILLPTRYTNRGAEAVYINRVRHYTPISVNMPRRRHFGQDFVIADISSDTIYLLTQDRVLTPLLTRNPSVHASEPRRVLTSLLKTDRFIFLQKTTLDLAGVGGGVQVARPSLPLMHEFETGQTYEVLFSRLGGEYIGLGTMLGRFSTVAIGSRNMDAFLIPIEFFTIAYERNMLTGDLERLAATLDEEDNPVVAIVTFK